MYDIWFVDGEYWADADGDVLGPFLTYRAAVDAIVSAQMWRTE